MQITQSMHGGATITIKIIYPELGTMDLDINGGEIGLRAVDLDVMLNLVKGLDVHPNVSLLSEDHSTHGKSHTKQDIIDFIESLQADREMEARVKAEVAKRKEQQEVHRDTTPV